MFYEQLGSDWLRMATAPSNLFVIRMITNMGKKVKKIISVPIVFTSLATHN